MGAEREEKTKLLSAEMSVLRKMAGVTRLDYIIRNEEIKSTLQQRSIVCNEGEK